MEPITTRAKLIENLKNVLSVEISAKNSYEEDLGKFEREDIKKIIERIRDDEIKHIEILEKLIEMLKEA